MEEFEGFLQTALDTVLSVVPSDVTLQESLLQLALAAVLCLGAWLIRRRMHPAIVDWCESRPRWEKARSILEPLIWPLTWLVFLSLLLGLYVAIREDTWLLEVVTSLLVAWVVVRLVSRAIRNPMLSRITAVIAYGMAVLSIWDLLGPTIDILNGPNFTLTLGEFSLSVYQVLATALLLAVLLSLAGFTSRVTERRLREADWLTPAGRVLLNKSLRIALFVFAILITIGSVGIDLTALAVIGGAVGFGIGFGLQKVFSNLISGVILLTDKSIKPGDVITVENTYGWVNKLGARYVSIITRDGIEHLIPNETMITEPVSNWTHSDANTRLRIPIGVHYDTNLEDATRLGVQAARSQSRVLKDPAPRCLVKGFGESAIDLEIRFWIQDADSG
ncbi:MAG: mechanosensitive ion channel, partial [Gammaproteobacteria bacterium]|nr:mechanosensitive ion channel [Gammaproteobacteria bacterium]